MMIISKSGRLTKPLITGFLVLFCASWAVAGAKEKVLYSFQGGKTDGASPIGNMVLDKAGNVYGATSAGEGSCSPFGCGEVFEMSPPAEKGGQWTETILHVFTGIAGGDGDGGTPAGGLIFDSQGSLYGTTGYGGTGDCVLLGTKVGCGTVYELSPPAQQGGAWTETILYSFPTNMQGYVPNGELVFDAAGNLYGATTFGGGKGTACNDFYQYCGAVFELSPPKKKGGVWTEKVLHSFAGLPNDGANPNGPLLLDSSGAIYGTTYKGGYDCPGSSGEGCGTLFKLIPPQNKAGRWRETILHRFKSSPDGNNPQGPLVFDKKGNLFGTTSGGGTGFGQGTVFRFTPNAKGSWSETILYSFQAQNDGAQPTGGVLFKDRDHIFGTASSYGTGIGLIFKLVRSGKVWKYNVVYDFTGSPDGAQPSDIIFDSAGNLFGSTLMGGTGKSCQGGCGTVYKVTP